MNVQWEDENLGESICNALKKEEVTYADIEGITGISIDSQYVVKLDWKDKTEQYVYNSGNDMCEILELQDFSTLADLKKFPYLRELYLNECIVDDNTALGELTKLENLKLDGYSMQRRCKLGYARAARIMDEMEQKGIIGPYEGAKPRAVLISRQQWLEMQMNQPDE